MNPDATTARIRVSLPALPRSGTRVARAILDDPAAVVDMSVADLASAAGTAPSSVVLACQRMGFRGFPDLKLGLVRDLGRGDRRPPLPFCASTPPSEVKRSVFARSAQATEDASATVSDEAFEQAVRLIRAAARYLVVGFGTSHALALDVAHRFRVLGRRCEAVADPVALTISASQLGARDVCLAISHTGTTEPTLAAVRQAVEAGARIVAVTSYRDSPLARAADVALTAGAAEGGFRLGPLTSRLAHLAVVDALYVALALDAPDEANGALEAAAAVAREFSRGRA